jgi:type IV pilus assembly protein PilV
MRILRQESAFTLLEVLVAMLLLTIGMLGVTNLTIGIIKGNSYSKNVTTATVVAEQQIEQAQRIGYAGVDGLVGNATVPMGGTSFTRTTAVTAGSPDPNMKTVSVGVTWNPGNNSVSLNTIISQ